MTLQNIGLLDGLHAKMGFLNKRQQMFAQNIANSDTPGYRPKAMNAPDFSRYVKGIEKNTTSNVRMAATHAGHFPNSKLPNEGRLIDAKDVYEAAPDDNSVVLEEQMFKASKNMMDYQAMINIYRRNVGMLKLAVVGNR